jgi:ubiquitin-protein ligase
MPNLMKVLFNQYRLYIEKNNPYYLLHIDEENMKTIFVMVCNLPDPWDGAELYFKLIVKDNFPEEPPEFHSMTPNGLYEPGGRICISIGEFHKNDSPTKDGISYGWRKCLGINGFIECGIINSLIDHEAIEESGGIRILKTPKNGIVNFSKKSRNFNQKNFENLYEKFETHMAEHPDLNAIKMLTHTRSGITSEEASKIVMNSKEKTLTIENILLELLSEL